MGKLDANTSYFIFFLLFLLLIFFTKMDIRPREYTVSRTLLPVFLPSLANNHPLKWPSVFKFV